jgi:hypothetical protein
VLAARAVDLVGRRRDPLRDDRCALALVILATSARQRPAMDAD